ncbi:MAG: V-type ATPase subunit [Candidatus Omnitrophota bacterium]
MRELAKYAFSNAKIRAMLSNLISPEMFSCLLDSKDVYDLLGALKETQYKDIAEGLSGEIKDLRVIEKLFLKKDIEVYRKAYESLSTRREKELAALFIQRYELEELKVVLRLWHKKAPVNAEDYLSGERISFDIDFEKILYSQTIEEIIILLDHTPYKGPLLSAREKFKERNSSFYLEASLDADYYRRLIAAVERLSAGDRAVARKILGIEIDVENINWLVRMSRYYSLGAGEILPWFIQGGDRINKDNVMGLYATNDLSKIMDGIAIGPYVKVRDLAEENVTLIENFLYEILIKEIKRSLGGFPFTIGTILGYFILKRAETRNIISLIYAKDCGLKREETVSLLNI